METFTVLVADPSRTTESQAVLGSLRRWSRRDGRNMQVVLAPTAAPERSSLGPTWATSEVVLLMQARQPNAARDLLRLWERTASIPGKPHSILPILVTPDRCANGEVAPLQEASSGCHSRFLAPVTVPEGDVCVEHGGLITLSDAAESAIEGALETLFAPSIEAIVHPTGILQVCSCLQSNTPNYT